MAGLSSFFRARELVVVADSHERVGVDSPEAANRNAPRHKGVAMGYGLKLWPEDFATVKSKAPEALNLEGL